MKENTVTQEQIDNLIKKADIDVRTVFDKCTLVTVKLENGFVITESSSCVDPKNYNENIGKEICIERIKNKLWELEGYKLQCSLFSNRVSETGNCNFFRQRFNRVD